MNDILDKYSRKEQEYIIECGVTSLNIFKKLNYTFSFQIENRNFIYFGIDFDIYCLEIVLGWGSS